LEVSGLGELVKPKPVAKKAEPKDNTPGLSELVSEPVKEKEEPTLSFDLNVSDN
jgi:hypothetical protein